MLLLSVSVASLLSWRLVLGALDIDECRLSGMSKLLLSTSNESLLSGSSVAGEVSGVDGKYLSR